MKGHIRRRQSHGEAPGSASSDNSDDSLSQRSGLSLLNAIEETAVGEDAVAMAQHLRMHQRRKQTAFEFTDTEIKEAFDQLDFNRQGFLTASELTLFLDVFKVQSTETEVCEMIRMADTQGLNKVFFSDFQQLLKGELVRTLATPLPDTLALLDNTNLAVRLDPQKKAQMQVAASRRLDFAAGGRPGGEARPPQGATKSKALSPVQRRGVLEELFRLAAFDFQKVFSRLQKESIHWLHINDFGYLFQVDNKAKILSFYESLGGSGCVTLNVVEVLVNWIGLQQWTESNRAYLAFMVRDFKGTGSASFEEVAEIFTWLNLGAEVEPHAQALERVCHKLSLDIAHPIDLRAYEKIIHNFAHLLIKGVKPPPPG